MRRMRKPAPLSITKERKEKPQGVVQGEGDERERELEVGEKRAGTPPGPGAPNYRQQRLSYKLTNTPPLLLSRRSLSLSS